VDVQTLAPGAPAPEVPDVDFAQGPTALFFFKVTCPVCQMAAPVARKLEEAYPGRVVGVGQDPEPKLAQFDREYGLGIPTQADVPPYPVSNSYGLSVVPTLVLVAADGTVDQVVESWDREGYNEVSRRLADLAGAEPVTVSEPGDGLPSFRPG